MRDLRELDDYRVTDPKALVHTAGWAGDETCGAFIISHKGVRFMVQASMGLDWDHVSVSTARRCPTWEEMEWIKRKFFKPEETAFQLHVAESEHINIHPWTLHLWRPQLERIPLPPNLMV